MAALVMGRETNFSSRSGAYHAQKFARVIPFFDAIVVQSSPETTKQNELQDPIMPACVGVGVEMPFPVVVADAEELVIVAGGDPQFCSTQYEFPTIKLQVVPLIADGFCMAANQLQNSKMNLGNTDVSLELSSCEEQRSFNCCTLVFCGCHLPPGTVLNRVRSCSCGWRLQVSRSGSNGCCYGEKSRNLHVSEI